MILSLIALFACEKEEPTEENLPRYSLFVSASEGGTVSTEGGLFDEGAQVTVTAIADKGYRFTGWEGIEETSASVQLNLGESISIKALFELDVKELSIAVPHIVEDLVDKTGYILAIENGKKICYLLDHQGQKLRTWTFDLNLGQDAELAPDGSLFGLFQVPDPHPDHRFGGKSGLIRKINTQNQVVWEFKISTENEITHHDLHLLPNGNVLVLVWQRVTRDEAAALGYVADHDLFVEKLVEVDPEVSQIVWQWSSWDHIIQDRVSTHPTYGDPKENPNKIDIMYNYQSDYHRFISIGDIMHANGITYLPELDLIAMSVNFYNEIWFIDHSTTTDEARSSKGGAYNLGGDLVYRFGNPAVIGRTESKVFDFLHHPSLSITGEKNNLLIYNNNAVESRSKAMEFELPSLSSGSIEIGPTPKLVFEYSNDDMFFDIVGGAQRLPNGNTLICEGDFGFWEVNPRGQLLWKYDGQGASFWRGLFYSKESSAIKSLGL
ncbi:MAG: hypothetical protein RLZZ242_1163 [Bacteroidota bacterium]